MFKTQVNHPRYKRILKLTQEINELKKNCTHDLKWHPIIEGDVYCTICGSQFSEVCEDELEKVEKILNKKNKKENNNE